MKKHLRVLAAVLVLCFSLLCPAASAHSVQAAAKTPAKSGEACGLQAVHCSRSDHFCRQKDGADGLGPNARRQKISQQVYLQQYERPGKGYIIESKSGRLHCLQKVLLRK